jgi:hypothetical protein
LRPWQNVPHTRPRISTLSACNTVRRLLHQRPVASALRLSVRTLAFHAGERGSIPLGRTTTFFLFLYGTHGSANPCGFPRLRGRGQSPPRGRSDGRAFLSRPIRMLAAASVFILSMYCCWLQPHSSRSCSHVRTDSNAHNRSARLGADPAPGSVCLRCQARSPLRHNLRASPASGHSMRRSCLLVGILHRQQGLCHAIDAGDVVAPNLDPGIQPRRVILAMPCIAQADREFSACHRDAGWRQPAIRPGRDSAGTLPAGLHPACLAISDMRTWLPPPVSSNCRVESRMRSRVGFFSLDMMSR